MRRSWRRLVTGLTAGALLLAGVDAQGAAPVGRPLFLGMGDSIGEGVQSDDANEYTQPTGYLSWIAKQMGAAFPLPLIRTGPGGQVGKMGGRSRIDPSVEGLNLAVSGADARSLLYDRAKATDVSQIRSETELVLFPRTGSQMQIAESLMPQRIVCWIGNNDVLGAVVAYDHLDVSQITPIRAFKGYFTRIAGRLSAIGAETVFGTVPDVTDIAFLIDHDELVRLLGSDFGLPQDSRTTIAAVMLVKLGPRDPTVFSDPSYVLDARELAKLRRQVADLNAVIKSVAESYGMGVADTNATFADLVAHPPVIAGVLLSPRFLGGLFSLDGVHPSPTGSALAANAFIQELDQHYWTCSIACSSLHSFGSASVHPTCAGHLPIIQPGVSSAVPDIGSRCLGRCSPRIRNLEAFMAA